MSTASRGALALGAAAALTALTAGCGLMGGDEESQSDEERLVEMLNESNRLDAELREAEYRIIRECLEDQGFTVHDESALQTWAPEEQDALSHYYPHEEFLPDEAEEYGFGMWADSPEAHESGEAEDYWAEQEEEWEEEEGNWEEPDNSAFEALSQQERIDWYNAYVGEEKAEQWYGWVFEEEGYSEDGGVILPEEEPPADEEQAAEEQAAEEVEGEIDFEGETWEDPKPGGCELEMIEGLYGEPERVEETFDSDGGSESYTYWSYRPENPAFAMDAMWEDIEFEYVDRMADLQYDFTDCLAERGQQGWEFSASGYLPTWEYFAPLYWPEEEAGMYEDGSEAEAPDLPDDVPTDYEGKKAYEIEVATAFAECDEELGYAEASTEAYDEVHIEAYADIEQDVYAWQEEMRGAIASAQDMIDA